METRSGRERRRRVEDDLQSRSRAKVMSVISCWWSLARPLLFLGLVIWDLSFIVLWSRVCSFRFFGILNWGVNCQGNWSMAMRWFGFRALRRSPEFKTHTKTFTNSCLAIRQFLHSLKSKSQILSLLTLVLILGDYVLEYFGAERRNSMPMCV